MIYFSIPPELDGGLMKQPHFICNLQGRAEKLKNLVKPTDWAKIQF